MEETSQTCLPIPTPYPQLPLTLSPFPQSADPDHVLVSEAVAAECAAHRGLPPPPVRAIAAKGKPGGIRCARFDWRAAAFVDHGWPPPPMTDEPPSPRQRGPAPVRAQTYGPG